MLSPTLLKWVKLVFHEDKDKGHDCKVDELIDSHGPAKPHWEA
jgi:hypothetical protein